jgi:hypothetical protein
VSLPPQKREASAALKELWTARLRGAEADYADAQNELQRLDARYEAAVADHRDIDGIMEQRQRQLAILHRKLPIIDQLRALLLSDVSSE